MKSRSRDFSRLGGIVSNTERMDELESEIDRLEALLSERNLDTKIVDALSGEVTVHRIFMDDRVMIACKFAVYAPRDSKYPMTGEDLGAGALRTLMAGTFSKEEKLKQESEKNAEQK